MSKATEGPYVWASFGGSEMLVTKHGGSKVILAASNNQLVTRNGLGVLVPLQPSDDIAHLLAASWDMREALRNVVGFSPDPHSVEFQMACDEARAALAKADGEQP